MCSYLFSLFFLLSPKIITFSGRKLHFSMLSSERIILRQGKNYFWPQEINYSYSFSFNSFIKVSKSSPQGWHFVQCQGPSSPLSHTSGKHLCFLCAQLQNRYFQRNLPILFIFIFFLYITNYLTTWMAFHTMPMSPAFWFYSFP